MKKRVQKKGKKRDLEQDDDAIEISSVVDDALEQILSLKDVLDEEINNLDENSDKKAYDGAINLIHRFLANLDNLIDNV